MLYKYFLSIRLMVLFFRISANNSACPLLLSLRISFSLSVNALNVLNLYILTCFAFVFPMINYPLYRFLKFIFYWHFSVKSFYNFQMTCLIQFCYISRLIIFNDSRFTINRICTNIIFFTKLLCYSFTSL